MSFLDTKTVGSHWMNQRFFISLSVHWAHISSTSWRLQPYHSPQHKKSASHRNIASKTMDKSVSEVRRTAILLAKRWINPFRRCVAPQYW
jgi:hypothetical protein